MGQYLQFRRWASTASGAERGLATVAVLTVVGLASWSLLPATPPGTAALEAGTGSGTSTQAGAVGGGSGPATTGGGTAAGPTGPAVTGGGTVSGQAGGTVSGGSTGAVVAGGGSGPATSAAGRPSTCPPAGSGAVGVTASTITAASVLLNLAGPIGNGAVGIASSDQQRQMTDAVVADLNAHAGAACRKIVVKYFEANPLDASSAQKVCLQIAQAHVYAVVDSDGFAYPAGAADCVAQHKIPIFGPGPVPSQTKQYFPYYMSLSYDVTVSYRNLVQGMKARGFFDPAKGFKKLGLYMDDCSPEVDDSLLADLAAIGIAKDDISIYTFSCPSSGFASPSEASAAVVQHRQDGVTHVIPVTGGGSFKPYSAFAQRQGWKPVYTIGDYNGMLITTTGGTGPDQDNFDGTVAVTSTRIGQESSGFIDPASEACRAVFKRHGVDPAWVTSGYQGGRFCNMWRVFALAAGKAPSLGATDLAQGLMRLGRVPMAYLDLDATFGPGDVVGGDFWWVVQYRKACNCWKVIDRTLKASYRR